MLRPDPYTDPSLKDALLESVWQWVEQNPESFSSASENGSWVLRPVIQIAETEFAKLVKIIEKALLAMGETGFIFYPSPEDPEAGWKEFFEFTRGYGFLPEVISAAFKKHYLLFQSPTA